MLRYIGKRIMIALLVFVCVTALIFALSNMLPGNAADAAAASSQMTTQEYENYRKALGLDQPAPIRYLIWLKNLVSGDMGTSSSTSQPVVNMIGQRMGPSLLLTLSALVVALLISVPLGTLAACRPNSIWEHVASGISFIGVSVPTFMTSLLLIYIFAVRLHILPAQGMYDNSIASVGSLLKHLILPVLVLALSLVGNLTRQTRGAVLDVIGEEYIKTARSKGMNSRQLVIRHILRNSLIPIVTTVGTLVPFLTGGAVITETIFSWPGIGSLMTTAIKTRDYNTMMGVTVVIAVSVLSANILIDIVYTFLDPRIELKQ